MKDFSKKAKQAEFKAMFFAAIYFSIATIITCVLV